MEKRADIMERNPFPGSISEKESDREKEHRKLIRRAAAEGMVLLSNYGELPLEKNRKVALYGGGARYAVIGGTGSGMVNCRGVVSIEEGLKNAGIEITSEEWLNDYSKRYEESREKWKRHIYDISTPGDFDSLYRAHAANPFAMPRGMEIEKISGTETAVYVISRISGEGADRKAVPGDYYLSGQEKDELEKIFSLYEKVIVVLNTGGIIDLSFMDNKNKGALVVMSQAGMEGGNALADVLLGRVNPCGKLTDTWARGYEDYPSSKNFSHNNGNIIEEKYEDGIYVGYRYFDSFDVKPRYCFGYGLSYTSFAIKTESVKVKENRVELLFSVKNTGPVAGREVVQVYASCPKGMLQKELKRMVAFAKTETIPAGETRQTKVWFDLSLLEAFHGGKSAWLLEKGEYYLLAGDSSENAYPVACLAAEDTTETEKVREICPLLDALKEIAPDEALLLSKRQQMKEICEKEGLPRIPIVPRQRKRKKRQAGTLALRLAEEILSRLSTEQKVQLVCGRPREGTAEIIGSAAVLVPGAAGETTPLLKRDFGVAGLVLADGPAGLRLQKQYEEDAQTGEIHTLGRYESLENRIFGTEFLHDGTVRHYQFCSAVPVGTLLAQTFDVKLMEEIGALIGREMKEFGVTLWLAPGMNIHRNPLCGRNFEYYSEDPLVSGKMASAITKGVQTLPGIGTTIKHYACNNQEENRRGVSSIVSQRALRELYLKGFEIAVKESQPMAIMTSYNKVNGVHTANSRDLCTEAARTEWGFEGIIMTDWTTTNDGGGSSAAKCLWAGNDLIMPGTMSDQKEIMDAVGGLGAQFLDGRYLDECALRMLKVILASDAYKGAESYLADKELDCIMEETGD